MSAKRKKTIYDGFFYKNPVLIGGLIAGPVIVCTDTLAHALVLCLMFSMLSFISVMFSSFVPRRLVYGLRIIVYSLIATLVYVPLSQVCAEYFPLEFEAMGIYLPLLTVSSLITTQTEFLFNRQDGVTLFVTLLCYILGFDLAALLVGFIRELLAYGTMFGNMTGFRHVMPGLATIPGGFLVTGLLTVCFHKLRILFRRRKERAA